MNFLTIKKANKKIQHTQDISRVSLLFPQDAMTTLEDVLSPSLETTTESEMIVWKAETGQNQAVSEVDMQDTPESMILKRLAYRRANLIEESLMRKLKRSEQTELTRIEAAIDELAGINCQYEVMDARRSNLLKETKKILRSTNKFLA